MLRIGVPSETKPMEGRVALIPEAVADLVGAGLAVHVQSGCGLGSGFSDQDYARAGAVLQPDAGALYGASDLVVKVKEPTASDLANLRPSHTLFCFLHLAPNPHLTDELCRIGLSAIAFETLEVGGRLPLLAPMSEIAGRVAVQAGAHYLHGSLGGSGVLLGGVAGTPKGQVVVLGAGMAGRNAALCAAGLGASVTVFDRQADALRQVESLHPGIAGRYMSESALKGLLPATDLLIGAVLLPGKAAPRLVTREMVAAMPAGSVIVDISIDQGGCVETMRVTDYRDPVFVEEGIVHMGVANLPGAVPRTASCALSGAILPWVQRLATVGPMGDEVLVGATNVRGGAVVHPALMQKT
jgi:alanine dehydrogenase